MIGKLIAVMFVVILFGFLGVVLYEIIPQEPIELRVGEIVSEPIVVNYGAVPVFMENLRFSHNRVSYSIESACVGTRRNAMLEAFGLFAERMGIISFYEVSSGADIRVGCSDDYISMGEQLFAAGEGGPSMIINTSFFKTIEEGKILLYEAPGCDYPVVALHELCHVFGFDHSDDPLNVMYNTSNCRQRISADMVELIYNLYSIEPLADASIGGLVVVKKGKYLDFNISVLNEGLADIDAIDLELVVDGEVVQVMHLDYIGVGYGRSLQVQNIRLPSLSFEKIEFVIDRDNVVRELNEDNNVAGVASG